jgi:hypothetical protein
MNSFILTNPTNKSLKLLVYQSKVKETSIFLNIFLLSKIVLTLFLKHKNWSLIRLRQISTSSLTFSSDVKTPPPSPSAPQEQPRQRSSGSGFFKLVAFALTGFTLGMGYVTLNPDSRKQIEAAVPQSSQLFEFIDDKLSYYKKLPTSQVPAIQEKVNETK